MGEKVTLAALSLLSLSFFVPASAQDCVQKQFSTDGSIEACLLGPKVRAGVLTVKVLLKNTSDQEVSPDFPFKDLYYADLKAKKKYHPLKDSEDNVIAGPKYSDRLGGRYWVDIQPGKKKILWVKFPAPSADCSSVDIFVPGILPFEGIPLN